MADNELTKEEIKQLASLQTSVDGLSGQIKELTKVFTIVIQIQEAQKLHTFRLDQQDKRLKSHGEKLDSLGESRASSKVILGLVITAISTVVGIVIKKVGG